MSTTSLFASNFSLPTHNAVPYPCEHCDHSLDNHGTDLADTREPRGRRFDDTSCDQCSCDHFVTHEEEREYRGEPLLGLEHAVSIGSIQVHVLSPSDESIPCGRCVELNKALRAMLPQMQAADPATAGFLIGEPTKPEDFVCGAHLSETLTATVKTKES